MKIGDLIKFTGSWDAHTLARGRGRSGVVTKVWINGRTGKIQSADVFWDNGDCTATLTKWLEVVK